MNGNSEINEHTRFSFTPSQLIGLVIILTAILGGWFSTNATLQSNRMLLESSMKLAQLTRDHQINNEYLIDQHSAAINELRKRMGLPPITFRSAVVSE